MASINLQGDTSGSISISAPSVAGSNTLTLPATTQTLATQNALGVRNLIINGDMNIAQRATSASGLTTTGYYTLDRWKFVPNAMGTWTMSQDTDVPSGQGFSSSLKLQCTTADASPAAADYLRIYQKIEAQMLQHLKYGTSSAEKVTFSFWVKSNKTGTYTVRIYAEDNARHIVNTYTIDTADTWEKKTITFNADTTGTINNDNGSGFQCDWWFGTGSSYQGGGAATDWESSTGTKIADGLTVNLADSTSNYINITGVQLEVGDTATPFEHRPYDMELERCKRYYERITAPNSYTRFAVGQCVATTQSKTLLHFTEKRAVPSIAFTTASLYMVGANTGGGLLCTAITSEQPSYKTVGIVANVSSGLSAGNATYVAANNTTSAYIEISSEL